MEAARIGVVNVPLFGEFRDPSELVRSSGAEVIKLSIDPREEPEEAAGKLADLDVVIAGSTPIYDRRLFARLPKLKAVIRWGVGYDNVVLEDATREGVIASRLPAYVLRDSVAEHTIALILSLLRRIPAADSYVREGRWEEGDVEGLRELVGERIEEKIVGIIGLGNIGLRVLELLKPLKPRRIIVYDPYVSGEVVRALGADRAGSLEELLALSDIITIHAPLTPETRRMLDRRAFEKMKPGAYLVNTARGGIIDPDALLWALESGILKAAALDVFDPEPIPANHPILRHGNVILTPHIGSGTISSYKQMDEYSIQEALRILRGEKPLWILNPEVLESPRLRAKIRL
ncbi:MAG: hydroxyacid dehydrogenase [Thaumarchaeota archaeon]|nr:MAG: hydroxyacid dehydrogenase [Nitrososphaerota archaeon]